jgi:hypothetical protein
VRDHEHVLGEHQDGDVAPDFGTVEVRLKVYEVGKAVPAVEGVIHDVGHQARVEAGLLQGSVQALALGGVVV